MARPIKDTPILTEEEWERLEKEIENVQPIPDEEREEQKRAYEWFKKCAKFPLP